jgi:hypothetical protein
MIKIFNNFLTSKKADIIERDLLGMDFYWHYNDTTKDSDNTDFNTKNTFDTGQFIHKLLTNNNIENTRSNIYEGFSKVFDNVNYNIAERVKCNLNLNVTGYKKSSHQPIHQDQILIGYKSLIYYINDSDGDTIFFNKNLKEIKRVKPKKNTAVLFNSNILHCGCNPIKTQRRAVINFIFKGNENSILHR